MDQAVAPSQKKKSSKPAARGQAGKAAPGPRSTPAKQAAVKIPPIQTLAADAA